MEPTKVIMKSKKYMRQRVVLCLFFQFVCSRFSTLLFLNSEKEKKKKTAEEDRFGTQVQHDAISF